MVHSFDIEIAKEYGMLPAVLLNHLWYWIEHNRANDKNYYDGEYWTFNSIKAFEELFPYASQRQIQTALKKLKDGRIIKTGNYNKLTYDHTTWYTFTDFGKSIMQKCQIDYAKMSNRIDTDVKSDYAKMSNRIHENVEPIPDNNTYIKQDNNLTNNNTNKKHAERAVYYPEDERLDETFKDFLEMRKKKRVPNTDRAITLAINKINDLAKRFDGTIDNEKAIKLIEQSILAGWTSIYPLKENTNKTTSGGIDWDNV